MAKKFQQQVNKNEKYDYPSHYGSHASMIDQSVTTALVEPNKYVVLKDENGNYVTERSYLHSGMADPYRSAELEWRKKELGKRLIG